jgi:integration host factor subunit beta
MTRSEIVEKLAQLNPSITLAESEVCVSIILDEIMHALEAGNRVELRGFGVFTTRQRRARLGRNPRTGESVEVEAKAVPFFKAGKDLRNKLNA